MNPDKLTLNNKQISEAFEQLAQLMEIHGQNPFRAKAIGAAAYRINKLPFSAQDKTEQELTETPGIGASTAQKITTLLQTGTLPELEELRAKTPVGIIEMLGIKGLGPKKIQTLWKELGLETLGEVYYACNENRLIGTKGFGLKTQEQIKKTIEFTMANTGWIRYATIEPEAERIMAALQKELPVESTTVFTGEYRRKNEVLKCLDIISTSNREELSQAAAKIQGISLIDKDPSIQADLKNPSTNPYPISHGQMLEYQHESGISLRLISSEEEYFAQNLWLSTGSEEHVEQIIRELPDQVSGDKSLADLLAFSQGIKNEKELYERLQVQYIEPELREGLGEVELAKSGAWPPLIELSDLKGVLHNHSTYSDGVHSLEEMALYARDQLGLEYFGISDHSQAAFYARGLSEDQVRAQWAEIDDLNQKLAPFHIFKGIESDILNDGSLDYPDEILAGFDFVVASVHTNLNMDEEKATARLIKAIENPYTTILGHPTARLLLSRAGYPLDHRKIIDACAANQVVIEINANPLRLDMDWRWHQYALSQGVLLSINPDAHRQSGLHDMKYGVYIGRKGGLSAPYCLNAMNRAELAGYLTKRKEKRFKDN